MSKIALLPSGEMIDLDSIRRIQKTDTLNEWGVFLAGAPPSIIDVRDVEHIRDHYALKVPQ